MTTIAFSSTMSVTIKPVIRCGMEVYEVTIYGQYGEVRGKATAWSEQGAKQLAWDRFVKSLKRPTR